MKTVLISLLLLVGNAHAQVTVPPAAPTDSLTALGEWASSQQKYLGVSYDLHKVKYVSTWWDAVSIGTSGLNVGNASSLDFVDLGPGMALANGTATRYGQAVPLHVGNIWNSSTSHMPSSVASHVHLVALPNVTLAPMFLVPSNGSLKKWTFKNDFQVALAYRFGPN